MNILFFDVETTGLDHRVNGIHQLAGIIMIDGVIVDKFEYFIRPFAGCEIDSRALEVSNTSYLGLYDYPEEKESFLNFKHKMDDFKAYITPSLNERFFLAGWRSPEFDNKFLEALFERNDAKDDFKSFFWSNPIDVKVLATQFLLKERPKMASFSLVSVAKHLGVKVNDVLLHTAYYDAYLTRKIYEIVAR